MLAGCWHVLKHVKSVSLTAGMKDLNSLSVRRPFCMNIDVYIHRMKRLYFLPPSLVS